MLKYLYYRRILWKSQNYFRQFGDFDCLVAAVQNGADAVYFGSSFFNARASATNFNLDNIEKAIDYAKLRGVKTHLTLNTLIKNCEFEQAIEVANKVYSYGIDAIIVQDLGLARYLIKNFPRFGCSCQHTNDISQFKWHT